MKTKLELDDINRAIKSAAYHQFAGTTVTVCCLTLQDGFNVIGQSACIDPVNFDEAMGRKIAHDDAVNKVWQLEGYLLNYKIKRGMVPDEEPAAAPVAAASAPEAPPAPDAVLVGTEGAFYPSEGAPPVAAKVIHVWTESCVNLELADGGKPTSVLVFRDPAAPGAPAGYFFVPGVTVSAAPAPASDEAAGTDTVIEVHDSSAAQASQDVATAGSSEASAEAQ